MTGTYRDLATAILCIACAVFFFCCGAALIYASFGVEDELQEVEQKLSECRAQKLEIAKKYNAMKWREY